MVRKLSTCLAAVALLTLVVAKSADAATINAHGSVEQVYATDLAPGAGVQLRNSGGQVIRTRNANHLGSVLFRNVVPGPGYRVASGADLSDPLEVLTKQSAPPASHDYGAQTLPADGYGYMEMRDGVELAYTVHKPSDVYESLGLPIPPGFSEGTALNPSPTLIEYSGYGTADPDGPESGISALANLMGYTVVDVNMRGTGCSGGAYDFFEPLQGIDGYDIIETVAAQDWVKHNEVGMFGISFGGISQLFVSQYQPPNLSAITPLSLIDQTQTTLYPGGILNTGFAFSWALDRVRDARPSGPGPGEGQPWAWEQIQAETLTGDTDCLDNQDLHPEAVDLISKVRENDHYIPEVADPLSPLTFVDKINVPTLMACQWTDEQTGGSCPTMAARMTGTDNKFITYTNGTHVDSLSPDNLTRLYNFLEIYVNKEAPLLKAAIVNGAAPIIYEEVFGISGLGPRPDTIMLNPSHALAKTDFEAQKPIRILYDNGAGTGIGSGPGNPYPAFVRDYDSFPAPGTTGREWFLGDDGALADAPASSAAGDGFTWDQDARPDTNFVGNTGSGAGGLWTATPTYQWMQDPAGTAVAYATEPLTADTTVLGGGAIDVWVRSSDPNVDLQATVSEIRPDDKETFVQGGWVSGEHRALDPVKSTPLAPVLSLRQEDVKPVPSDKFTKVTIPLYYQGHVYRAGSRIRIRISAPSNDQPVWSFGEAQPAGTAQVAIGRGPQMPSRLVLPIVADGDEATGLPPCPGLRGEPCRPYADLDNAVATGPFITDDPPTGSGPSSDAGAKNGTVTAPSAPACPASTKKAKKKAAKKAANKKKKRKKRTCGKKKKRKKKRR